MTGNQLISNYQTIWEKYYNTNLNKATLTSTDLLLNRGFVFEFDQDIQNPDVLFIGINPSYAHGSVVKKLFYTKEQASVHSYFKPFHRVENHLKDDYQRTITWTHMDLLVFRETQQSYIHEELFKTQTGLEFILAQLEVARELLEFIHPKIIVVSNTMAKELLGRNRGKHEKTQEEYGVWMGLNFEFDKSTGTDKIIDSGKLDGTHVFFTSMLSGQRALDRGTFQRLVWHINEVLK